MRGRKSRFTETDGWLKRRLNGSEAVAKITAGLLEARWQLRQIFWCAASFVSALFETDWLMKGYAGGLGASAFDRLHIGLLG
jgi:hypothetical protein